jgi:proline dehydrogenase
VLTVSALGQAILAQRDSVLRRARVGAVLQERDKDGVKTTEPITMIRRSWQSGMIALARSQTAKVAMQRFGAASALASRFVAGANAEEAVDRATALHVEHSIQGSFYYLGEYVDRAELVAENVSAKLAIAVLLGRAGLEVHVSVDPTQIGHSLDPAEARRNAFVIAQAIQQASGKQPGVHALMFDMEDHSVTDATIALHDAVISAGLPAALTLPADLRRTEADTHAQIRRGARLRLVKGAFVAGRDIAFTRQTEIKVNSRRLIELMFSRDARDAGSYPSIATHDDQLQAYALEHAAASGWLPVSTSSRCSLACAATLPKISRDAASASASTFLRKGLVALCGAPHRRESPQCDASPTFACQNLAVTSRAPNPGITGRDNRRLR